MSDGENSWAPMRRIELTEVLREGRLAGLIIGDPDEQIVALLGAPQVPVGKLSEHSKLWSWSYGNVTVLTAARRVERSRSTSRANDRSWSMRASLRDGLSATGAATLGAKVGAS